jgi:hypothetical protein
MGWLFVDTQAVGRRNKQLNHGDVQAQVFSLVGNHCEPRSGRREGSAVQSLACLDRFNRVARAHSRREQRSHASRR